MRKLSILLLFFCCCQVAYNQIIKGTILDEKTKICIPFASVYFNGTFVGTTSDKNGNFELNTGHNTSKPVTISAIGYFSSTLTVFSTGELLQICLTPKVYEISEAVVKRKSLAWKRRKYMAFFKEEFLGTSVNALQCEILNEKDITFNYDSDKDTIKAFALKPIEIDNKGLGYKITCFLDKFEFYKNSQATFFRGNIIFREDNATGELQSKYNEHRKFSYSGSSLQFFRALWEDKAKKYGFTILDSIYNPVKYKEVVLSDSLNNKFLSYHGNLNIGYSERSSRAIFLKKFVHFDKTGYYDPTGINWNGFMAFQRMGDWLPYEYSPE